MYYHSNESLDYKIFKEYAKYDKMLSVIGGADIALLLAGHHKVNDIHLCDVNPYQYFVFASKKEFIENDELGVNYLSFFYIPSHLDFKDQLYDYIISRFLDHNQNFVRTHLEEIFKSKNQLYSLFLKDYVDILSKRDDIYNHLRDRNIHVNFFDDNILNCMQYNKDADVIYLSNILDFARSSQIPYILETVDSLKDDVIIYDSSKTLQDLSVPFVMRYSKEEYLNALHELMKRDFIVLENSIEDELKE